MSEKENLISSDKLMDYLNNMFRKYVGINRPGKAEVFKHILIKTEEGTFNPDPVPTIKPGDKVNHYGEHLPFLKGVKVSHLMVTEFTTLAVLTYEGQSYPVTLDSLEVVKDE